MNTLAEIMAFVDEGLFPFTRCPDACKKLVPASLGHGPAGTVTVRCGRCKTYYTPSDLAFLTDGEARAAGWRMAEVAAPRSN